MNKILTVTLIVLICSAFSAMAKDTTYICTEVGDWDRWDVPTSDQEDLVSAGFSMRVTEGETKSTCGASKDTDPEPDYWKICKPVRICSNLCVYPDDYPSNCPCSTCSSDPDGTSVMVQGVVTLLLLF